VTADAGALLHALCDEALAADPSLTITRRAIRGEDIRVAFHASVAELLGDRAMERLGSDGWHCYFGVAPRRGRDGTKDGCAGVPALWADLDAKDFSRDRGEGKRRIVEQLEQRLPAPLHPSALIDSGGGYQAYWFLREFAVIGDDWYTVETLEGYLRGLQRHLGADPARTDVSSILRLPGTVNWKPEYLEHPLCRVVELDSARRFNLSDFDDYRSTETPSTAGNAPGWAEDALDGIDGPATRTAGAIGRDQTGAKLAGKYLGRGLSAKEVLTLLRGWNLENRPPLPEEDLGRIVASIARAHGRHAPPAPALQSSTALRLPEAGLVGVAKDFADLYGSYLESPRAFFYFTFLAYLGDQLAHKITLDSELRPQPRLYVVVLGESADTRKSTVLRKVDEFFRSLGPEWTPNVLFGIGSAEGIAAELKDHERLILHFDEFKAFVDKAKNEHSVALPMVSTLYERTDYDNRTREQRVAIRGAALTLVAACTADTYASVFDQRFLAIGFPNRLWLVTDRTTARIAVPRPIPEADLNQLRQRVRTLLENVDQAYARNGLRAVPYRLTTGALERYKTWYAEREGSIFERRLDTYAHRLMLLLAASSGRSVIDEDLVDRVILLLRYQLDVRREYDPVDAENTIAAMEQKMRRTLKPGAVKGRDLKKRTHYERVGTWIWKTAIDNLIHAGEVAHDHRLDLYWLKDTEAVVPTSVPSEKEGVSVDDL
jgi:primase-like protein/uncharacterized protein DUF3987